MNPRISFLLQKLFLFPLLAGLMVVGSSENAHAESDKADIRVQFLSLDAICKNRNDKSLVDLLGVGGAGKVTTISALTSLRDKITDLVTSPRLGAGAVVIGRPEGKEDDWKPFDPKILFGTPPAPDENRKPETLSAGQKKREAIAQAVAPDPKPLILDEPTKELDAGTLSDLNSLIEELTELQQMRSKAQEGVKVITDRARENPSDENRRDAALARKSNQTFNYQRAVIDAYIRELIAIQRALDAGENPVSFGDEEPEIPETDEDGWSKIRRTRIALDALNEWETERATAEAEILSNP